MSCAQPDAVRFRSPTSMTTLAPHRDKGMQMQKHTLLRNSFNGAPHSKAGVVLEAHAAPVLIPPTSSSACGLTLSRVACKQATRAGILYQEPHVSSQSVTTHPKLPQNSITRSAPVSPWGQPRKWGVSPETRTQSTQTPLASNSQNAFVNDAGTSRLSQEPSSLQFPSKSKAWANPQVKPVHSIQELYQHAHEQNQAPLTMPVGLINQGNSCFASAILQMLVFCRPLYRFLADLYAILPQDLSNSTPLLEAIFRFYAEIPLATNVLQTEVDIDPIMPDYIYDAMRLHKRFELLHLGHQEDAEEFFSLLLTTLHDEVLLVEQRMQQRLKKSSSSAPKPPASATSTISVTSASDEWTEQREIVRASSPDRDDWLEVGQKGKTSLTRNAGTRETSSPISRMFEGKIRSQLSIPGSKTSIVLEPYRALPLDIQRDSVRSIEDALKQLVVPEEISGVWSSGRHAFVDATKQLSIELLPPILVLHFKRFVYDEVGGVQKSCKPIAYGQKLSIDPSILSAPYRKSGAVPEYALFGVVYHHGRLATGGHYTASVLRQDNSGWIHIDDTYARTIPTEAVLHGDLCNEGMPSPAYLLFYHRI
ncbi:ubiquitinyl hydrolase 1 [Malassezia yamatoensis]|uniref:Ubiquitin carboxyl-terminal hydrolase n=1 Tax=Malassezia yamatoensis TaxID=253288 RepID=A0AAJ5YUI5_9BASI|nr:ubiquitinyl hydrolase 1 [Malassezia yamatoensis]